jgi:hypothetical protein
MNQLVHHNAIVDLHDSELSYNKHYIYSRHKTPPQSHEPIKVQVIHVQRLEMKYQPRLHSAP